MNILIDNLTMSFKIQCLDVIYHSIGIDPGKFISSNRKSYYGYPRCVYYEGIRIHWRCTDGVVSEVCLECSGKGCRTIEEENNRQFDWFKFLNRWDKLIRSGHVHISRIDIACDDVDGITDLEKIKRYIRKGQYVCKAKTYLIMDGNRESAIYFGSTKSDRRLRIYNKAMEQRISDNVHWIRYEFQLRDDCATSFYLNWCNYRDIGKLFAGVMIDYLRFVEPGKSSNAIDIKKSRHHERLSTASWWDKFVCGAERIPQLYLPGNDYSLESLENYIKKQTNSSVKAYLIANGGDVGSYLEQVKCAKLNAKQLRLLRSLGMIDEK